MVVALEQHHSRTVARGRQGGRHSRGTATDHDHIGLCRNARFARRLDHPITNAIHCSGFLQGALTGCHFTTIRSIRVISRKNPPARNELMMTAEYNNAESKL